MCSRGHWIYFINIAILVKHRKSHFKMKKKYILWTCDFKGKMQMRVCKPNTCLKTTNFNRQEMYCLW